MLSSLVARLNSSLATHHFALSRHSLLSSSCPFESRPTKQGLGEYCFFIDCEGHISDELVADCLRNVHAKQADVKFLGSFPVSGHEEAHARRRAANKAWRAATAWVDELRAQVRESDELQ